MTEPPEGAPEPLPTNTQETTTSFSIEDFQPRVSVVPSRVRRKRARNSEIYSPEENTGRVRQLIDTFKDIIHHQTGLIESTKAELQEVRHDQNVL